MRDDVEIRAEVGRTLPDAFRDYERRIWEPGGFQRDLPMKRREWRTKTGWANVVTPKGLDEDLDTPDVGDDALRLTTLRSNDGFNTTVHGYDDRFRGINNTRTVVLMNRSDIDRMGLSRAGRDAADGRPRRDRPSAPRHARRRLRYPDRLHRRRLPRAQRADAGLARRDRRQDAGRQGHSVTVHSEGERVLEPGLEYAEG